MKKPWANLLLVACLLGSGVVGCGPEVAVIATAATQMGAIVGTIGGTVWLLKTIENVSLDTEKKKLEIRAIQDGNRQVHEVDLTDAQFRAIQQTGFVRLGDQQYRVD
ncbi:MAG: hypothetical protein SFV23_16840 [Planctomycetaceae bacterium]|nr:hypothetical protein [Planctomycetaceae bacterium]